MADQFTAAHTSAHDGLHEGMKHSHEALDQIRKLESELRVRKALLKGVLASDLMQRASALKMANAADIAKIVDEIVG